MSTDLPKQELLIKLMGMTGSASDGEALNAMRLANKLVKDAGWTWERILQGKIKVVENPFIGANPFADRGQVVKPAQAPVQPTPTYRPAPPPPPTHKAHYASASSPLGSHRNKFAEFCYCCGNDTPVGKGYIFDPWTYVPTAVSKWRVTCESCNTHGIVRHYPAAPIRNRKKAAVTDLA